MARQGYSSIFKITKKQLKKKITLDKVIQKSHEKVNALQAKLLLIFKTRLVDQKGNYLKPVEVVFSKKSLSQM